MFHRLSDYDPCSSISIGMELLQIREQKLSQREASIREDKHETEQCPIREEFPIDFSQEAYQRVENSNREPVRDSIQTDPSKIDAVRTWPVPKTVKEVRMFIGYYRRFVPGYASIVRPLNDLLMKRCVYWLGMGTYVEKMIKKYDRCIRRKILPTRAAAVINITSTAPMEVICIDYMTIEPSKGGIENVLVITDHFMRYAQAIPTLNQTAHTTARLLYENFFVHYGSHPGFIVTREPTLSLS